MFNLHFYIGCWTNNDLNVSMMKVAVIMELVDVELKILLLLIMTIMASYL